MRNIRIGLGLGDAGGGRKGLDGLLARFRRAEQAGFQTAWVASLFGFDALTLAALAGRETGRIEIGTAVVPTFSRHPVYMAQQALSTQAATGGRFVLGLGPSHRVVIEDMLGLSYEKPARHVREYVTIVKALLEQGQARFQGRVYRVNAGLNVTGGSACPVLLGALGPIMRRIAGRLADGTITWMTGPRTLGEAIVPDLRAAAREAGRPAPRVVVGLPVAVTSDPDAAREAAAKAFAMYGTLPSYRAMLDAEGVEDPAELLVAGDESAIERSLERLASAGATDFNAAIFPFGEEPGESMRRSFDALAELARQGRAEAG